MAFNYNNLWKLLIDRGMRKEDLRTILNISSSTIAKMGKNKNVSMDVINRICNYFGCDVCDVMHHVPSEKPTTE